MENEKIERSFNVSGTARLNVGNVSGTVDIQPGDDGVISVIAVKRADSGDAEQTEVVISQAPDGTVIAETRTHESMWNWFGRRRPCDVDFTVRVPRQCSARVRLVSSTATVRGLAGEFELQGVSGDVTLADLSGPVNLKIVSGNISGQNIAGAARIDTVSGDVRLAGGQFPSVRANTVSGEVQLETSLGDGPYDFHSVSGNVVLMTPANARCSVDGTSVSGGLKTSLPNTNGNSGHGHWHMDVQGGGARVSFNSISGDLVIGQPDAARKVKANGMQHPAPSPAPMPQTMPQPAPMPAAGPVPLPPPPPPPPLPPKAPLSRAEILNKVERGELSVEDAIKALDEAQ